MKKLSALLLLVCLTVSITFAANNYKIDDVAIDQLFVQSEDVTLTLTDELSSLTSIISINMMALPEGKTVGGYLLRAYFCGFFALHRSYMGTGDKNLFFLYFCVPVASSIAAFVDFWWVVFKGEEALNKYTDNPKWFVWAGGD
ncbi:MAG: hypothetical protein FVQ77_10760 [Cytophagales bacterium]|nr:hypothetical protein [Cytophagales bacterium]